MMTKLEQKDYRPVDYYFVADPSYWPLVGSCGLFATLVGAINMLHHNTFGTYLFLVGILLLVTTMFGWFRMVVRESVQGLHSNRMDKTYRWGMMWFIVSEVALFGVFFGALFYTKQFALPELSGTAGELAKALLFTKGGATHKYLWPHFQAAWPLLVNPNPELFPGPERVISTWGIPALNTLLLLSSAVALTWSHWGFKTNNLKQVKIGLVIAILLGMTFTGFQIHEYLIAHLDYHLTIYSGIFGSTFFMLTGLHAAHVTVGVTMMIVILIRCMKGHFRKEHHFGFEAVAWYWHFVDVVWLFLFVFVYWI